MTPMIKLPLLTGEIIRSEFNSQIRELRRVLRGSGIRSDGKAKLVWGSVEKSLMAHYGMRYWNRGIRTSAELVFAGWLEQTRVEPSSGRIAEVVMVHGARVVFSLCGLADAWAGCMRGPDLALRYLSIIYGARLKKRLHAAAERDAYGQPRRKRRSANETAHLIRDAERNLRAKGRTLKLNEWIADELGLKPGYVGNVRRRITKSST